MEIQAHGGSSLAGYKLIQCLGYTTHTAVYRALGQMGTQWALKVVDRQLDPDGKLADRLKREADLLSRLDHPGIPPIYETGRTDQVTFATIPLLDAAQLADVMANGDLDLELAWRVLNQLADALDRAHRLVLNHRCIKPTNILIESSGRVYLAEFGISSSRLGPTVMSLPSYELSFPQYLSPEQVQGHEPDAGSDVYSTAVLVFEMLTGTRLFEGESVRDVLGETLRTPCPPAHSVRSGLPSEVDGVLARALSKNPRDRQRTAFELIEDLISLPGAELDRARSTGGAAAVAVGAPAPESALATLHRMGVSALDCHDLPLLNSYFATIIRQVKEVAGSQASTLLTSAGLDRYVSTEPPSNTGREASAADASRLADAFEPIYGAEAPAHIAELGRAVTEEWMRATLPKPLRVLGKAESKVSDTLYMFNRSMDHVRGEELHATKQIDKGQFWVVHHGNLFALGRRKPVRSCHYWVAAFEAALRWGGLTNDWVVEETECACVTGAGACVFTLERTGSC